MAHSKKTIDEVRAIYINDGLTISKISEKLNISASTISLWKQKAKLIGDDWDKLKAVNASGRAESVARNILIHLLVAFEKALITLESSDELEPAEQVNILANLSESFARSINANKKIMPEVNKLEIALWVMSEFTIFLKEKAPHLLESYAAILEAFSQMLQTKIKD
ncbi:MAG: DUF1804 family protein [Moraxella sp.]